MTSITNEELIEKAEDVIRPRKVGGHLIGNVGCALVTDKGNLYRGVCIDTSSGMGFCAEHGAIAAMVTAGEFRIGKLVGVRKDKNGTVHVLPPCGRCREFMRQINEDNLEADIILGKNKVVKLRELLPYHDWFGQSL